MSTLVVKKLIAEGITQAQVQEEADAAGVTISPEFQAEMDAQGVASSAKTLSLALSRRSLQLLWRSHRQ
jgi:hypothetical protein